MRIIFNSCNKLWGLKMDSECCKCCKCCKCDKSKDFHTYLSRCDYDFSHSSHSTRQYTHSVKNQEESSRFIKLQDCYLDKKTLFRWSLNNYGPMTWYESMEFCVDKEGYWGLPSIQELQTLIDLYGHTPVIELPGMLLTPYWSSDTVIQNSNFAWSLDLDYAGQGSSKHYSFYIRLIWPNFYI